MESKEANIVSSKRRASKGRDAFPFVPSSLCGSNVFNQNGIKPQIELKKLGEPMLNGENVTLPSTVVEPQDDPAFLAIVDHIIAALVYQDRPEEVYLVHIDNWFDHKWLRYSGYGVIAFPQGYPWILVAKEEHRQEQLTFPPFTPNRVVAQYLFCRVANASYEEQAPAHLIHRRERQRSAKNLYRRVTDFSSSGLFVWYSSGSVTNRRGSLMVYNIRQDAVATWYAGFSDRKGWRLDQAEGIGRETVALLMGRELPV